MDCGLSGAETIVVDYGGEYCCCASFGDVEAGCPVVGNGAVLDQAVAFDDDSRYQAGFDFVVCEEAVADCPVALADCRSKSKCIAANSAMADRGMSVI